MTTLHTITPTILIPSGLLFPGIYLLPDISITFDGDISCSSIKLGTTKQGRGETGSNSEGAEFVDERWLEVFYSDSWTPIGGGPAGDTVEITETVVLPARLNIPDGAATTGDFVANTELFYVE